MVERPSVGMKGGVLWGVKMGSWCTGPTVGTALPSFSCQLGTAWSRLERQAYSEGRPRPDRKWTCLRLEEVGISLIVY